MVLTEQWLLQTEVDAEAFLHIAQRLVGHRSNSAREAMRFYQVDEKHYNLLIHDLHRIGIFQCRKCGLWYWQDQMEDGVCTVLCKVVP
jgi:hypothetical protein